LLSSKQARSCSISPSAMRAYCPTMPMRGRARLLGCSPRSNTVEPPILELVTAKLLEGDKPWSKERLPLVEGRVRDRLNHLSARLGDADWLDGAFSAGDLMMGSVLLRLKLSGVLDEYANLAAYVARGEARPAYKRAFDAQLAANIGKPPTG
jgi:glutathione S-transferase